MYTQRAAPWPSAARASMRSTANSAQMVLPLPVGAHTSDESSEGWGMVVQELWWTGSYFVSQPPQTVVSVASYLTPVALAGGGLGGTNWQSVCGGVLLGRPRENRLR
eukprot:362288-Chlamydomonas_euryale.AAC.3